ncbi:flagellar hook-length control protein FliK [Vibrio sp. ES.051]|uniref:flagellar hook-length control protein FliK n=1 Tax=Vibrio sp. ES.051 TaxID=1761909 RepID=UPI000BF9B0CB|nr:flagellar hook-length control protein FliK [Vibrio sp. ES.051]PFG55649.1 flagellar hook-length control protein FliK [Vibrio sp. ES.051]
MNVNLSNASATNKTSASDSTAKGIAENSEKKGFFETLADTFTGSQTTKKTAAQSADIESEASATGSNSPTNKSESQETVAASDNADNNTAADNAANTQASQQQGELPSGQEEYLDIHAIDSVTSDQNSLAKTHDVTNAMGEGQQLLGRLEQANQALQANAASVESGKEVPLQKSEAWQNMTAQVTNAAAQNVVNDGSSGVLMSAKLVADAETVQRVSLDQLELIDTKLAQGKSLTAQEIDVIEGLKTGAIVADMPNQDFAQFVALPSELKQALAEQQATQQSLARQASAMTTAQQAATQEMKHAAAQSAQALAAQNLDKAAMSSMPDALVTTNLSPALQGVAKSDVSHQAMNAALTASALQATADKQDKPDLQHGLAGQIQAAAGQQGVSTPQQARIDAAQQAQLPLQLTKELANEQVAEKVQMMMSKNLKNLDIRLDPPELGRMQIRMTMNNDIANVHFTVSNPQARDIVDQALPRLREMLAQQGMQLADSSVQQQNSGQQQDGYAASDQSGQGTTGRGFSGHSEENFDTDANLDLNVVSKRDGISFYA